MTDVAELYECGSLANVWPPLARAWTALRKTVEWAQSLACEGRQSVSRDDAGIVAMWREHAVPAGWKSNRERESEKRREAALGRR
jgi:hypothetical protein